MNLQNTLKILLVDDGHLVTTCENPVQAIELLKKEKDFNLIISNFNMPLMTGELQSMAYRLQSKYPIYSYV